MTKLASKLPTDHGLTSINQSLIKDPDTIRVAIVLLDTKTTTTDTDTGNVEPTIRVRRIEVVTDADKPAVAAMIREAIRKRSGATVLDGFEDDMDQDMKAAFGPTK